VQSGGKTLTQLPVAHGRDYRELGDAKWFGEPTWDYYAGQMLSSDKRGRAPATALQELRGKRSASRQLTSSSAETKPTGTNL